MRRSLMFGGAWLRSTPIARSSAASPMSFEARLGSLEADPECPLSQPEYKMLQERLADYVKLQGAYAVKQSDIERTRRAANVCGLDFPEPKRREEQ